MKSQYTYVAPYNFCYTTFVKKRWLGKSLLFILSVEFKDYTKEYFENVLTTGQLQVLRKGEFCHSPDLTLVDSDLILHFIHRHESPALRLPYFMDQHLQIDDQIIDFVFKPARIPVHPSTHFNKLSLINQFPNIFIANRLDSLVSGPILCAKTREAITSIGKIIQSRSIFKGYLAQVRGDENFKTKFSLCFAPLRETLACDDDNLNRFCDIEAISAFYPDLLQQVPLQMVKPGVIEFDLDQSQQLKPQLVNFIRYLLSCEQKQEQFSLTQSAVSALFFFAPGYAICYPLTGRTHQLRLHLNYVGNSIADDPLYGGDFELIKSEIENIMPTQQQLQKLLQEEPFCIEGLRRQLKQKMLEMKAYKSRPIGMVEAILQKLKLPENMVCETCELLKKQVQNRDQFEEIIKYVGPAIKIVNPHKYQHRFIRLAAFCYIYQNQEVIAEVPEWSAIQSQELIAVARTLKQLVGEDHSSESQKE